jgi:mRNA interferase MazF
MSFPKKGEIWWVSLPGPPRDPHQPRTAIIVSRDSRNSVAQDVLVVPTFSKPANLNDTYVEIAAGEGGLPKDSVAKCDQVTTLDKEFLQKGPLGDRINQALMWQIHRSVRRALGEKNP